MYTSQTNNGFTFSCLSCNSSISSVLGASTPAAAAASKAKTGCNDTCGDISIPYPFGIGPKHCYLNKWHEITCNNNIPRLSSIKVNNISLEVLEIDTVGTMMVRGPIVSTNCSGTSNNGVKFELYEESPFYFNGQNKIVTVVGCNNITKVSRKPTALSGCVPNCNNPSKGICRTSDPEDPKIFDATVLEAFSGNTGTRCAYAFLIYYEELESYDMAQDTTGLQTVPVMLDWGIPESIPELFAPLKAKSDQNGSFSCGKFSATDQERKLLYCMCNRGYDGNPYLLPFGSGCKDIDECADQSRDLCPGKWRKCSNTEGSYECSDTRLTPILIGVAVSVFIIIVLPSSWWLYKTKQRRNATKLKENLFKQLLLEQQSSSNHGNSENPTKLFKLKELCKATDNFNDNRIVGKGGQGTVYKGMLEDGRIVAVKRTNLVDEEKIRQFINEIVILSQVNHRNVVKLLGCCLETEAPLLVYEFVPNGTLFQHIQQQNDEFQLTWNVRLQIAVEASGGLAYLHSAASMPVYHRDVKSTNILLDEKFRAKISDFGTSRSVSIEQTHLTTAVQGTFGYMDPEYFQTSQYTDKSDVYSFGVVLVELLTGLKPVFAEGNGAMSLVAYFLSHFEENTLFQILDDRVVTEGHKQDIFAVANIARRCLQMKGIARPTMRTVATELEGIKVAQGGSVRPDQQEVEYEGCDSDESHSPLHSAATVCLITK